MQKNCRLWYPIIVKRWQNSFNIWIWIAQKNRKNRLKLNRFFRFAKLTTNWIFLDYFNFKTILSSFYYNGISKPTIFLHLGNKSLFFIPRRVISKLRFVIFLLYWDIKAKNYLAFRKETFIFHFNENNS